jgi:hypothetical protein
MLNAGVDAKELDHAYIVFQNVNDPAILKIV